jgi:hypothetical protein
MKTGITLITMGAGNVKVLGKTLESFKNVFDEVVYGDMLLFEEDRDVVVKYQQQYNMGVLKLPFNYIFKHGFADTLNILSQQATNDIVLYMNTSEIIDEDYGIVDLVKNNLDCNTFYFVHRTDPHRWFRMYNRKELEWSGVIHEQLKGEYRPYHKPIFMMADLEKDMDNLNKADVFNSVKEIVYFRNYNRIVDYPAKLGETDPGWIKFATENYDNMKCRMQSNAQLYEAFCTGSDLMMYQAINNFTPTGKFKSSDLIEYQGDPKYLNKI